MGFIRYGAKAASALAFVALLTVFISTGARAQAFNFSLGSSVTSLSFAWTIGSSNPAGQAVTIDVASPCQLSSGLCRWPTALATNAAWLSVTPPSGTTALNAMVTVNPTGLSAGTYTAAVTATAQQIGSTVQIPVTLVVTAATSQQYSYSLGSSKRSMSFAFSPGGAAPAAQNLTIWDTSPCPPPSGVPTCHWPTDLTTSASWLSVTPASGATSLAASVSVNPAGLAAGTYTANVTATASELTGSPLQIPVTLTVAGSNTVSQLSVNPATLSFGNLAVGSSNSLSSSFTNTGASSITIGNVSIAGAGVTASGISSGQVLAPNQSATLSVTFAPSSAGAVAGTVTVTSNASNSSAIVAVSGAGTAAAASHSVTLSWSPSSSTVVGYNVYRGNGSGGPYTVVDSGDVATTYTDTSVAAGATYYYVVTAVDSSGDESVDSNQTSVTVP